MDIIKYKMSTCEILLETGFSFLPYASYLLLKSKGQMLAELIQDLEHEIPNNLETEDLIQMSWLNKQT